MKYLLPILCAWICFVSAFDIWLSCKYPTQLPALEVNPLGRWLIRRDGGDVGLFMACKFLGYVVVMRILRWLAVVWPKACRTATVAVAVAQGILLVVLLCW